jgi:hypothetical protein
VQAVAPEEAEVRPPDHDEKDETDEEGNEAEEHGVEFVVGAGYFEGDDDEGEGEAEDDVGETFETRHGGPTQSEAVFGYVIVKGLHACGQCSAVGRWISG